MIDRRNLLIGITSLSAVAADVKFKRSDNEACKSCKFFNPAVQPTMCMRFPEAVKKGPSDWCGEFQRGTNQFGVRR